MRKKAARWRPRLAHRSAAVHRGRGLSRWRSGLPCGITDSSQRSAARTRRKCACFASSRERERGGAFACAHTRTPAARWKLQLARQGAAVHRGRGPSHWRSGRVWSMGRLQPARRSARTPQARVLRLFPRESARRRVRVFAHANAGCSLEAAAGTSGHGRSPRERAVSMAQCVFIGRGPTRISAAQARTAQARVLRLFPRESARVVTFFLANMR